MKNKMPKRLLSLLLVLAMLLPMAPASLFTRVQAAEDNAVVLYFNNSIGWTDVYCYVWDVYENKPLGEWPGTKMPLAEHYLNKISVPTTNGIGVIIHNGSGTQTKNLGLSDEQVMDGYGYLIEGSDPYLFNSSDPNTCWQKCRFPVENNGLVTFTYEGSATTVQIAGTMNNWEPVDMVKTGSVFSYTFQLEETRYEYKLVVDGTWVNDPLNPLKDGNSGNNYLFVDGTRDAESVVVIAGSDFQGASVSTSGVQVQELLQVIQADYPAAHGFLFGGDYSKQFLGDSNSLKACVDVLKSALNSVYPGLGVTNHAVYVQGNHDPDSGTTDGTISTSGAHDTGAYGVYVINEKDYMWYNNDEATIKNTATALDNYLDAKYSEKYNKPIFVVSHLPLHYSMRTATAGNGDAKYANYLFDVLNEAGARGQSIIFLFGHDHSNGWDDYMGAGAVYLERGDKINIAQASTTEFEVETLNFTYMNAGYVGYYDVHNTGADGVLSMTVFEVFDDHVEINRYSKDGKYNLKSAGVTNAYKNETAYGPDKEVYSSPKSIPVNNIVTSSRDVTIAAPNVTKANVAVYTPDRPAGYSAYRSYYAGPAGYTDGDNAIITVDLSKSTSGDTTVDAFDPSRPVIITELATGVTHTVMMEDGKVTFETEHFGRFTCAQVDTPAYTVTAQGGGKLLQRVTDIADLQEGVPYVISEESFAKTLTNIAKTYTSSGGTVYNGLQLISDAPSGSTPYVWYYKDGHLVYGSADSNQYLSLDSGGVTLGTDVSKAVTITQNTAGNDNMYFSVVDGTTTRYVQLRGGASTNDVATVYNSFQGKIYFHFDELIDGETTLSVIPGQTALTTAQTTLMVPTVTFEGVETDALEVTWRSSDESIATVDENGKVTAIRPGNATIYASVAQVAGAEVGIPISVYKLDEQVSTVSDIGYVPLDKWNAINDIVETNDVGPYRISSASSGWYLTGDYIQSTVNTNTGLGLTVEHDPADVWYYVNGNLRYGSVDGPYLVALTDGKVNIGTDASRAFNSLIPMENVVGGYQVNNSNMTGTSYTKLNQNGGSKGDTVGTWYDGTWIFEKLQSDAYELNLQVSPGNPTLRLDRTEKLNVSLLVGGVYDTDYTVIWSSSDSNVVSVTEDGRITGMSVGNATVTCRLTAVEGVALQSDVRVRIPVNVYDDSEVPGSIIASGYLTETLARNEDIQPGVSGGPYVLKDYSDGYYISGNGLVTSANGTVGLETVTENYMDHQWYYDGTHLRYGSMDGPYMAVVDGKVNLSDNVSEAFDLVARTGTYDGYVISHSSAPTRYVNRLGGGVNIALGFYSGGYHSRWYFYDVVQTPVTLKVIPETDSLYEGNSTKLISFVSVDGEDTTNYTISWASTNPSVATVDQNGNVTAVSQGRANMVATLTAANGQQTMLQVQIPVTVVRLSVDDTSSKATFQMEPLLQQVTAVPEGASGPWLIANYTTNDILTGTMDTGSTLNENGLEAKRWRNGDYTNLWFYDGERLLYGDVDAYDRMLSADEGVVYLGSDPSAAFDNLYTNTNYAETMTMSGTNFSGSYLNHKYSTSIAGRYNSVGTYGVSGDGTSFSAWKAYTLSKEHESVFYVRPPQSTIEMGSEFQLTTGLTLSGQQVTDFTVTWSSLNPEVAEVKDDGTVMAVGNGTATILATLHTVGVTEMEADITVPVTVTVSTVKSVTISSKSGTVNQDSGLNVEVGPTLTVTYADGSSKEVKMTVEHLKTGIGQFYPTTAGEYTTLKVVYEGYEVCADFNLEVVGLPDYPEYPNEGAVFVDKNAYDTVNFQNSGIAQVELEVSGIPADKGADVIIMLDTSSSMGGKLDGDDSKTRLAVLVESLNNLLTKFQTKNEDGTSKDINVAIANFQSYFNGSHHADDVDTPYYMAPEDTLRDAATPSNSDHKDYLTVYTGDQTKTVGAFTSVSELGTNPFWSEYSTAGERGESRYKINRSYGTNYDYGFDVAYQLADAVNTKNAAEGTDRDLYIIFMSDGHPFQYNYFHSASRVVEWNNWLSGTMTDEMFAEGSHREYYNADGKHWMAEALKGSPTKQYKVIRKNDPRDVDGDNILYINGLGATMYSIGFCMKDDNLITRESGDGLIDRIASSAHHAFHTSTAEGLAHAFDQISEEIMLAVSNAYLVDTMGENFDLQLGNPTYTMNGQQIKLNNAIEIYEYEIYTLADYETGQCNQNQIGARKPTEPKLVERVTFNDDGTEAYSNLLSGNILKNGIIHASTFFYNTADEEWGVVLDDRSIYDLAPETFYWKVGTISTNELALSYYVYLTGSEEGDINAGIYPTNEKAILYYDNYLNHESEMTAPVPVMAWNQAQVGYGFYLVDKNGNPIINSQGQVGDFQLSVKLGDVVYREFNAGDDPITLTASQLINIPELSTYRLFDSDARYTVSLMEDGNGAIAVTTSGLVPLTTYVTGLTSTPVLTGDMIGSSQPAPGFATANTVVWFAVTEANDALIVDKTVEAVQGETNDFSLTLESYATGSAVLKPVVEPADIVLVLDQSASMYTPMGASQVSYNRFDNMSSNASLQKISVSDLNTTKGKHLGYYVAQTTTVRTATDSADYDGDGETGDTLYMYDWFVVQYVEGTGWVYVRVAETTKSVTVDLANKVTFNPSVGQYDMTVWDGSNGAALTNMNYYQSQYGSLYDSVNEFVRDLAATGQSAGVEHRIAITGFASPYYDGIANYDGSGVYIDGDYYLYDSEYRYMGYTTSANTLGLMLYVPDDLYESMQSDLPAALENITWSRSLPANAQLVRLDPNKSNSGPSITGSNGVTYKAGQYFAPYAASGSQLTFQVMTDELYANALTNVSIGNGNVNPSVLASVEAIRTNYQQTSPAAGLDMAKKIFAASGEEGRDQIVILFTDGVPTLPLTANREYGETGDAGVAERHFSGIAGAVNALNLGNDLKESGVQLYTIGTSANAANSSSAKDKAYISVSPSNKADKVTINTLDGRSFLIYLSSDFNHITAIHEVATVMGNNEVLSVSKLHLLQYGVVPDDSTPLDRTAQTFSQTISDGDLTIAFDKVMEEVNTADVTLGADAVLQEYLSDYFDLNGDVEVLVAPYTGPDEAGEPTFGTPVSASSAGFSITLRLGRVDDHDNAQILVSGFSYSNNFLRFDRENEEYLGYKLIVKVPVTARDGFWGGNNVPTNDNRTAIYTPDGKPFVRFPMPQVNVPMAPVVNAQDQTVYYGNHVDATDLLESITVGGVAVNVDAQGNLTPKQDWMDDYATLTWTPNPDNAVATYTIPGVSLISSKEPSDYTFGVTLTPKTAGLVNTDTNPSNLVGAIVSKSEDTDSAQVHVLVPVIQWRDTVINLGEAVGESYYAANNLDSLSWVDVETEAAPTQTPLGTEPTLTYRYSYTGKPVEDTAVDVHVLGVDDEDITHVTTFLWWEGCEQPSHKTLRNQIMEHLGSDISYEFYIHVIGGDVLVSNKTVAAVGNQYELSLEGYVTGSIEEITVTKPADIVLVLDHSASMRTPVGANGVLKAASDGWDNVGGEMTKDELDHVKGAQIGYYMAQSTSTNAWFVMEYKAAEGRWYGYSVPNTEAIVNTGANAWTEHTLTQSWTFDGLPSQLRFYKSQYAVLYDSILNFVEKLRVSGVDHSVSIIGFAGPNSQGTRVYVSGYNADHPNGAQYETTYKTYNAMYHANTTQARRDQLYRLAMKHVQNDTQYAELLTNINAIQTNYSFTSPSSGMAMADDLFTANDAFRDQGRDRVVLLFTDGIPNSGVQDWVPTGVDKDEGEDSAFESNYTQTEIYEEVIDQAHKMKMPADQGGHGATVYSVSTSTMVSSMDDPYDDPKTFLLYASSDFPDATSDNPGQPIDGAPKYTMEVSSLSDLEILFNDVTQQVAGTEVKLDGTAILKDSLSDYMDLAGSQADVKVYEQPYLGNNQWGDPVELNYTTVNITASAAGGRLDTIEVSGFDYSQHYISEEGRTQTITNANGSTTTVEGYRGSKLLVKVMVKTRDGFWGGNNVPTNKNDSAIYGAADDLLSQFPEPQVNVTVKPVITAKDQVVYYGETGLDALEDLVNAITVGGMTVTYDEASGTFRPAEDWMDDFAGMSWNAELLNPADTTVSGTESGDYTFGVVLVPNTTGTGNNNPDNPGNIVGNAIAATGVASDEATGHVDVLVPVITFQDSTIELGDVTDKAYYESTNRESDIEWVNSDDAYGKNGLPTEPTAKFSTEPTLSFTYTPVHTAQNYMENDTSVNVKVYRDGQEITGVAYFDWVACNAELHQADQTVKDDVTGDTFHRHKGSTSSGEFFVHVTYILTSDAVVIDYGLNVNMNVLVNDILPEDATLVAVDTADQIPGVFTQNLNSSFKTSKADEHGVMEVFTTSEGKTVLKYTPTDMQLDGEEIFVYAVKNGDATRYYYSTATVIPATTIYYEDNFDSIEYINGATSGDYGVWKDVQQIATGSSATDLSNVFQGQDRPGTGNISDTDADQLYGYDDVYTDNDRFSMGSAKWVRVDATHDAAARFTFTGTGFDIISLCNNDTGLIMVDLYAGDTVPDDTFDSDRYLETIMVDTFFGCTVKCYKYTYTYRNDKWNGVKEEITYDQIGKSTMEPENPKDGDVFVKYLTEITSSKNPSDVAYQAPVIKREGLEYGTYSVEIYVAYSSWMEGDRHSGQYCDFYLDAIRVYDPADNGSNSQTVQDAYLADGEGWPVYQELRNMFITQEELSEKPTFGIVYMDGGNYNIGTYKHFGANNEVYLAKGETIGFKLDELSYMEGFVTGDFDTSADSIVDKIHLGIKGLQGKGAVTISNGSTVLNLTPGTTDMYYDLTSMKNTVVTITNTGNSIISLTNVKITHTAKPVTTSESGTYASVFTVNDETVQEVLARMAEEGEQEPVNPTVNLQYPTLSFEDEISYNIYFDTQDMDGLSLDRFGLAAFSTKDAEGTLETADAVMNGAVQDGDLLVVSTNGIPAKYLGDTMYFKVFAKLEDGTVVYSPVFGYSAQVYAKSILNSATSTQKQKSLVVAMLNYGAAAQTFFGYRTDALANANLTDEQRGLVCDYSADLMDAVVKPTAEQLGSFSATAEGFVRKYPTISFEGAFSINYYFTLDRTADAAPQLYYWTGEARENADVLTVENASGVLSMTEDGGWQAAVTDIAAKDLDDTIWVAAVYEADGVRYCSGVLSYSIGAYCVSQAAVTGSAMAPFAQAAAVYGSSAKAYFG